MKKPRAQRRTVKKTNRAVRLARVTALAEQVFGDNAKAHRWLRKPKRGLDGATPLASLDSAAGARLAEDMLYQIDSGIFA
jgi:putative toxin-antitoxin system antitoxin component (TIGR02293 family)